MIINSMLNKLEEIRFLGFWLFHKVTLTLRIIQPEKLIKQFFRLLLLYTIFIVKCGFGSLMFLIHVSPFNQRFNVLKIVTINVFI